MRGSPDEDLAPALVPRACAALLDAGILNADLLGATNARAASLNAKIQKVKRVACGFRNRERFRNAILFHLGGLDLSPQLAATHTRS